MSDINEDIKQLSVLFPGTQVDLFDNALVGGLQLGYDILNDPSIGNLNIGIGAYYLYVLPGSIKFSFIFFGSITFESIYNSSLIPILGGITYTYNINPIYLGANASVGYGFASFSSDLTIKTNGQVISNASQSDSASGLVAEGKLIIGLNIIKELSVELNVGYRYAPIGKTDFSGIIATLGANIRP